MLFHIKLFRAKKLSQIIDLADEYVFHGNLEKIIEVTYSYRETEDWFLINETLFEEYLWKNYTWEDMWVIWRKYRYNIWVQLVLIDDLINKTRKIKMCSRTGKLRRDIFIESLEYVKDVLELSLEWLEFELQKAWEFHKLWRRKIQAKIRKLEKMERNIFWEKIIHNSDEYSKGYNLIERLYSKNRSKLSNLDQKSMKTYLEILKDASPLEIIDTPKIINKKLNGKFIKFKIPRSEYRKVFDTVCEFYWLPQRTKLTSAGSIYDGDKFLEIPRGSDYAYFTIEELLKLITHEIESHYINTHNSRLLLWNFRAAKNVFKEEWLAIFMEKIFVWCSYDQIGTISERSLRIMLWEVLNGKEFENFLRIRNILLWIRTDYSNTFIRSKRNYSFSYPGVQHKDVVYFRWLADVINYLKWWWEFRKLFLWKVWFHDLEHMSDIYNLYENKSEIIFPIFISDLIYYYLSEIQKDEIFVFNSQKYYLYLKKKYWFLDFDCFKVIEQIETKWRKIEKILNIFEKNMKIN